MSLFYFMINEPIFAEESDIYELKCSCNTLYND